MVVAGQDRYACPRLPVPDADGLVIAGADNPGVLIVKLYSSDVVQVAQQCEQTSPELVVPNFDLVVVSTRDKQRL